MSFQEERRLAQRAVHDHFAAPAYYYPSGRGAWFMLRVRLHTKSVRGGDLGGGYAEIIEGVTRALFDRTEIEMLGVTLTRKGRLVFPGGVTVDLDTRDADDGGITEAWTVTRA